MAETRPYSPKALSMRRNGMLAWGVILSLLWAIIMISVWLTYDGTLTERIAMLIALQVFIGFFGLLGVVFLVIGVRGVIQAKRFNTHDWALADALAESIRELWSQTPETAYRPIDGEARVESARLVEIERHFDAQTGGAITGSMTHQLRMFGTSFASSYGTAHSTSPNSVNFSSITSGTFSGSIRGLSEVNLGISTTTRDNLLGDALFAVFEAAGPAGDRDTYRVISMSQPGVAGWINDLVSFAAGQLGGPMTHSGTTVFGWSNDLIARFVPGDISYVTDRLKALHSRPLEERELVVVRGMFAGRNAVIATSVSIGDGADLHLMPAQFPGMLGHSVAVGMANAELRLGSRPMPALPQP